MPIRYTGSHCADFQSSGGRCGSNAMKMPISTYPMTIAIAELPEHLEARPVDEQVGEDERERREHDGARHPVRPARLRDLPAERAQRQRRSGVHQHAAPR